MASIHRSQRDGVVTWQARYREPGGRQRKKSFRRKVDAERFITSLEADKLRGSYIDPDAGKISLRAYAEQWLAAQTFGESTYVATELRLRVHVLPTLGALELRAIKPLTVQRWVASLDKWAPTYQRVIFGTLSAVLSAAVDDELIARNPCKVNSVRQPALPTRKVIPWTLEQLHAVHNQLPERFAIAATLGAGLGLRQGETFGIGVEDIDFERRVVLVRRQVKVQADNRLIFALPKGRKTREVPLPEVVADELTAHIQRFPPVTVTLPYETRAGAPTSVALILTTRERGAINRNYWNARVWKPALRRARVPTTRDNGTHALRHMYGSLLLDRGESIRAVSAYLGHADPGFTLRVYTHLMPSSETRTRNAIDQALRGVSHNSPRHEAVT